MRQEDILITNLEKSDSIHFKKHEPYEFIRHGVLGGSGNDCMANLFELPPQKSNFPYHYHAKATEIFYIISGTGIMRTPEGDKELSAGDVIVCPPGEKGAHKITNPSDTQTLVYLDVDTNHGTDVAFYPDSGKIGVFVEDHYRGFFKKTSEAAYYDGE